MRVQTETLLGSCILLSFSLVSTVQICSLAQAFVSAICGEILQAYNNKRPEAASRRSQYGLILREAIACNACCNLNCPFATAQRRESYVLFKEKSVEADRYCSVSSHSWWGRVPKLRQSQLKRQTALNLALPAPSRSKQLATGLEMLPVSLRKSSYARKQAVRPDARRMRPSRLRETRKFATLA